MLVVWQNLLCRCSLKHQPRLKLALQKRSVDRERDQLRIKFRGCDRRPPGNLRRLSSDITARGEEGQMTKGKNTIVGAVIGILVVVSRTRLSQS